MAQKKNSSKEYDALRRDISEHTLKNIYIFWGEERYLLEHYLDQIRNLALAGGFGEFNHRRIDARRFSLEELTTAVDTLPVFAERSVIEIHDVDIFKCDEASKNELLNLFSDIPDYVCLIFVYDTIEYKPDKRLKLNAALLKHVTAVEFCVQEQAKLVRWIRNHCHALGKEIDGQTAEYLAFITGGLMTALHTEIEKICAYTCEKTIVKADIDAVVTPVLDAVTYKLSDAIARAQFDTAAQILDELLRMREVPHKIIYSISMKLRQLLAAKICRTHGQTVSQFMALSGIRYEFQAKNLYENAKCTSLDWCRKAVVRCGETAYAMNSGGGDGESLIIQLLMELATLRQERQPVV
jgi:DNA polymerase-3 subunit delta